jgi:hypothetical protein
MAEEDNKKGTFGDEIPSPGSPLEDSGDLIPLAEELGESGVDTGLKEFGGSGSGLLDVGLEADDTQLGGILDEIYGPAAAGLKPAMPRQHDNFNVLLYDKVMKKEGWKRKGEVYFDDYRAIVFIKKNNAEKPKAYVMFEYSLRDFVSELGSIKDIKCRIGKKVMSFYNFLEDVRRKYLMTGSRKSLTLIRDTLKPRIALGYSMAYDPEKNLEEQITAISNESKELNGGIRDTLNQACEGGEEKKVKYTRGTRAFELYVKAEQQQQQKAKEVPKKTVVAIKEDEKKKRFSLLKYLGNLVPKIGKTKKPKYKK